MNAAALRQARSLTPPNDVGRNARASPASWSPRDRRSHGSRSGFACPIDWWFWIALVGQAGGNGSSRTTATVTLGGDAGAEPPCEHWQAMVHDRSHHEAAPRPRLQRVGSHQQRLSRRTCSHDLDLDGIPSLPGGQCEASAVGTAPSSRGRERRSRPHRRHLLRDAPSGANRETPSASATAFLFAMDDAAPSAGQPLGHQHRIYACEPLRWAPARSRAEGFLRRTTPTIKRHPRPARARAALAVGTGPLSCAARGSAAAARSARCSGPKILPRRLVAPSKKHAPPGGTGSESAHETAHEVFTPTHSSRPTRPRARYVFFVYPVVLAAYRSFCSRGISSPSRRTWAPPTTHALYAIRRARGASRPARSGYSVIVVAAVDERLASALAVCPQPPAGGVSTRSSAAPSSAPTSCPGWRWAFCGCGCSTRTRGSSRGIAACARHERHARWLSDPDTALMGARPRSRSGRSPATRW